MQLAGSPRQIDYHEWHKQFLTLPEELIRETRYFRELDDADWSCYLYPPSTHIVYGQRLLRSLHFDNSVAALRLWGFVFSEWERLYRARQAGKKVVALMGDLGALAPLIYSFPNVVAFYPDCLWWTPFLMQSWELLDEASEAGLDEDCCFVRASLGGFRRKAWFPKPDLIVATAGATCDDMAAVYAGIEALGYDIHYFELPERDDTSLQPCRNDLRDFLAHEYSVVAGKMETLTGASFDINRYKEVRGKINHLRSAISRMKQLSAQAENTPMGALEMIYAEFAGLSYYADMDECIEVIDEITEEMELRSKLLSGYCGREVRLVWVTPPADPSLLVQAERLGCRIVGSEYLIQQSKPIIPDALPFQSLAEAQLSGSLMGSTSYRIKLIEEEIRAGGADGVVISGIYGSSHCPYETSPIINQLRSLNIPVISFDVTPPGRRREQAQMLNRLEAFVEMLKGRKT